MSPAERPSSGDDHAEFEAIVARLRDEGWPEPGADLDEDDPEADSAPGTVEPGDDSPGEEARSDASAPADPVADLPTQWRMPTEDAPSVLDEEDEFVPDEPRPLPSGDLGFWGAAIALGGGLLWLFYLFFFDRYARPLWWLLAVAMALTGLVLIFLRQPDKRDDDWDDDVDGAVF